MNRHTDASGPPIFVVGNVHTGTTLIVAILRQCPGIHVFARETHYFQYEPLIRRRFPDLDQPDTLHAYLCYVVCMTMQPAGWTHFDPNRSDPLQSGIVDQPVWTALQQQAVAVRDHRAIFLNVLDVLCRAHGKARWVEKTPHHIFYIDEILRSVPDARIIEMIRDPRDILVSKSKRRTDEWLNRFSPEIQREKRLLGGYDPVWDSLAWRSSVRAGCRARSSCAKQWLRLRYEDLAEDPEAMLASLCAFLAVPFSSALMQVPRMNSPHVAIAGLGVHTDSVGRWKQALQPAPLWVCQRITGSLMEACGYACVPTPRGALLRLPGLAIKSVRELTRRLTWRYRLGGVALIGSFAKSYRRWLSR